jgi:hypothetical protein
VHARCFTLDPGSGVCMKLVWAVIASFLVFAFQACSKVEFAELQQVGKLCVDVATEAFQPKLKWDWYKNLDKTNPDNFPEFMQVMSTPMVADLNNDGQSEVVFTTWKHAYGYSGIGILRIVDGATGETIRSVGSVSIAADGTVSGDELNPYGTTSPLLIDLDNDGKLEIIYIHYLAKKIVALNFDGSKRWIYSTPDDVIVSNRKGLSAADLDKDGRAEIIVGTRILSESLDRVPVLKMSLEASTISVGSAFAISLDASQPDKLHIVNNSRVYDSAGNKLFSLPSSSWAAANLDGDNKMELVGTGAGKLYIADGLTGVLKKDIDLSIYNELLCTKGIGGGVPTIGDFDGDDSSVEIALATGRYLIIMNSDGEMIAEYPTQDCSSLSTGISSFDFNGDGKPEILYGDEEYFRIFELHQGALREITSFVNPSGTLAEYPVVADIDGNRAADLLVVSNNYAATSFYKDASELGDLDEAKTVTGVRAFESSGYFAWMPTRSIWNQYDYNPALVTESGRAVSSTPMDSFTAKMFRRNAQMGMVGESKCY